ncbi:GntR family transcriptional regulator [Sphingomonas cannabina]|uniref:GntR family transcriptional regulator n=1 Tax=Sphingomonas cannabina TaxID=2899123 RepID=UPI001F2C4BC2|nr:GntR family transcriptional regulator [Sphingomonas cannabina]UIJ46767.1 GntR family transcriptional regulator [Sphingomonas cannabina]
MSLTVRNLSDQLVDLVRDRILSGGVLPGSPIRQDALASEFGVSKIPLREALARLEQEGLVQSHVNRGFFVRALSAAEAEEVYDLRLTLEPIVTVAAALNASEEDRMIARERLASLEQVIGAGGEGAGAFNRAFHLALLRPSARQVAVGILERLHTLSERYVRKHLESLGHDERAVEEHRTILDAWLARDGERLHELTAAHIRNTLHDLRRQLSAAA